MSAVPEQAQAASDAPKRPSIINAAVVTWHALRELAADTLELAALEARAAGQAAVGMLAMGVVAAICAVTAWVLIWAALAAWLSTRLGWVGALLIVATLNAAAAIALAFSIRGLSARLVFSATRRALLRPRKDETDAAPGAASGDGTT